MFPPAGRDRDVKMGILLWYTARMIRQCTGKAGDDGGYQFYANGGEPVTVVLSHLDSLGKGAMLRNGKIVNAYEMPMNGSKSVPVDMLG